MQICCRKTSSGDLQSRLKVRKVLGVGESAGSKISQILGRSEDLTFRLPPTLALWLFLTTTLFISLTIMGLIWPSCLRSILPGSLESTVHLASSYAFLATMLGLTLRSGDKTSLQLVLVSLALFHLLSFIIAIWFLTKHDTTLKAIVSLILHLLCGIVNVHFYRSMFRSASSTRSNSKLKGYFYSILSFPSTGDVSGYDSS